MPDNCSSAPSCFKICCRPFRVFDRDKIGNHCQTDDLKVPQKRSIFERREGPNDFSTGLDNPENLRIIFISYTSYLRAPFVKFAIATVKRISEMDVSEMFSFHPIRHGLAILYPSSWESEC